MTVGCNPWPNHGSPTLNPRKAFQLSSMSIPCGYSVILASVGDGPDETTTIRVDLPQSMDAMNDPAEEMEVLFQAVVHPERQGTE